MNPFTQYSFEEILRTGIAVVVLFSGILAILYSIW